MRFRRLSISTKMAGSIIIVQMILLFFFLTYATLEFKKTASGTIIDQTVNTVADSLSYNKEGKLYLSKNDAITRFLSDPTAWFMASDENGLIITRGVIPQFYKGWQSELIKLGASDIRAFGDDSPYTSRIFIKKIDGRRVHILVGGVVLSNTYAILTEFIKGIGLKVYLPMAILTILTTILITRSILSGLSGLAREAGNIVPTERKAKLSLSKIPREFEHLVLEINGALDRLYMGYEERDRFLASAAHELRAPIAILQTRVSTIDDKNLRTALLADISRLINLAEVLLDIHRLGLDSAPAQPVNLQDLLKQLISDMAPLIIDEGYIPEFNNSKYPVMVMGDPLSLSRAVINLVQNAVMHGGGKGRILITLSVDAVITVEDEGPGIDPDKYQKIFEPFYKTHPSEKGTGLGLHLVKEIVFKHKGIIRVGCSELGGALFEINLPVLLTT